MKSTVSVPEREEGKAAPIEVKQGSVTVTIYTGTNTVGDKSYPQFTVVYHTPAGRVRKRFADLDAAKREAQLAAIKLANQQGEVLSLSNEDRASYIEARDAVRRLNVPLHRAVDDYVRAETLLQTANVPLLKAADEYAQAAAALRGIGVSVLAAASAYAEAAGILGDVPLKAAAEHYRKWHPKDQPQTVQAVVDELVEAKRTAGRSRLHVNDLEGRLDKFAAEFKTPLSEVTVGAVSDYIHGLKLSGRSKMNHLRAVTGLFHHAVKKKYLPREVLDEVRAIEKPEVLPTETEIFTPAELREMLFAARPELVPWLVVGGMCGLRSAELMRLDWSQVNLERRFVEVKALNAKTASRRTVPLCDAAVAWLTPHAKPFGRFAYYSEENKFHQGVVADVAKARQAEIEQARKEEDAARLDRLSRRKPFAWKKNALRHSFCSYRLAVTHDAPKVALEAGNSVTMIFRHYRELVGEPEAAEWFGILPTQTENIVSMRTAAESV